MQPIVQQALKKIIRSQPNSANWAAKAFQNTSRKNKLTEAKRRDLIRQESQIGSKLFGEIPPGHQREFFCLDSHTWVWYESWSETLSGEKKSQTVRYEVRDNGILKSVNGQDYAWVSEAEAQNLAHAAILYHEYVLSTVYGKKIKKEDVDDNQPPRLNLIRENH